MSPDQMDWLSLAEASEWLGVHPTTLRRWADAGQIPCFRTPGGHRRFRNGDLATWMQGRHSSGLVRQPDALVQSAVGLARQEMAEHGVSRESWYTAFELEEDRQQMRVRLAFAEHRLGHGGAVAAVPIEPDVRRRVEAITRHAGKPTRGDRR